jgi:hypothetical protein
MRLRLTMLACALTTGACTAVTGIAAAAPVHNRGLTIHAVPHDIIAGEAVLIYGQLDGPGHADQVVRLFHRIALQPTFTVIGTTRTNAAGQYEFTRPDGIVDTNRNWFVRGPGLTHSRTVHERVAALVSLAASSATGSTRHPIVFSGHVTPGHAGGVVVLQQQRGTSDDWRTIGRTAVGAGSDYQISHSWRVPGSYNVRVRFAADARNTAAASDPVSVVIQQTQVTGFTIDTSDPIVTNATPVTISGVLDQAGTTTPEPTTSVSLFKRAPSGPSPWQEVTTATTGTDGSYQFTNVSTATDELYQVRTTFAPLRTSAALFQGVQDVVTMQASASTSVVGGQVTFSGTVSPDKTGHVVYLERLGADNDWHVVEVRFIGSGSTFQFGWTFGTAGTKDFRARIVGGPANVGGASPVVPVVVSLPALSTLPTS